MTATERRAQIINVSRKLFSKKGFNGTTTKEIAQASGISEAMIFCHFASKEDLYTAIIDQRIQEVGDALSDEALQAHDDERVFGELARFILDKTAENPTMLRLLYFSALEGHELSDIFYSNHEIKKVMKLVDYIRLRISEGDFCDLDPILVARAFTGMLYTYVTAQHLFDAGRYYPKASHEEVVQNFLSIFLNGIRKQR
ncbi:MAG: TetR/AcrR family transcriptional regulator [Acidobacteria bacterium]|nr:TetR/AcrR family transcriptional regulator [Acidobacteriota bacterium]